jgi:hypothetical protein
MTDASESHNPSIREVQDRLHGIAQTLDKPGLNPETLHALSKLLDELAEELSGANVPPAEVAHLANSTAKLVEALHPEKKQGLLGAARDRLERAVIDAEAHAPFAAGLARQLLDSLANIGI